MTDSQPVRPADRTGFHVAIICALRCEADAVEALFDNFWEETGPRYGKAPRDPNAYTLGSIGPHNVVLVYMPGMGNINSTRVTVSLTISFPELRIGLVVGICGGVPQSKAHKSQIFLGDVIVSTGVVQYDFGWKYPDTFVHKDTLLANLGLPQHEVRAFLNMLQGIRSRKMLKQRMNELVSRISQQEGFENAGRPNPTRDRLYESTYRHKHHEDDLCLECNACTGPQDPICRLAFTSSCEELGCDQLIDRGIVRNVSELHFGQIASAEVVMKSAKDRDTIAANESVIGFEMEGAGAWDSLPTIVIKGVCDYADSHKNDDWHVFASTVAAACAGAILERWREESDLRSAPVDAEAPSVASIPWTRHGYAEQATIAQPGDSLDTIPRAIDRKEETLSPTLYLVVDYTHVDTRPIHERYSSPPDSARPLGHSTVQDLLSTQESRLAFPLHEASYASGLPTVEVPHGLTQGDDGLASKSSDYHTSRDSHLTESQDELGDSLAQALEGSLNSTDELVHGHSSRAITNPYSWGLTGRAISRRVLGTSQTDVYSEVCEIEDLNTGQSFVRKILRPKIERGHSVAKLTEAIKDRVERMHRVRRYHIITVVHWFSNLHAVSIYMEPVAEYSLQAYLDQKLVRESQASKRRAVVDTWFGCLSSALSHVHSQGVVHGNIKTSNILIKSGTPYLTDFGSLVDTRYDRGVPCATDLYPVFPTELLKRTAKDDVLVLGCIFAQILHVRCPNSSQQYNDSVGSDLDLLTTTEWLTCVEKLRVDSDDRHLLVVCTETRSMLSNNPAKRPTAQEVKRNMHRDRGNLKLFCRRCY